MNLQFGLIMIFGLCLGSVVSNAIYDEYDKAGYIKYKANLKCEDKVEDIEYSTLEEAAVACNVNPKCQLIEQIDCKDHFELCTSTKLKPSSDDCIYKKDEKTNTEMGARSMFEEKDFVFNLKGSTPTSSGLGGTIRPLDVTQLPSLAKQGVSYSLFNIDACGINLPHVHPRATELLYVIKGNKLRTAFVEENGGRTLVNDIGEGMATFFPEGLIHYQQNLDCEPAEYISALNSEDPGVLTISTRIFTLPDEALQETFNLNAQQLNILRAGIPAGPAKNRSECLQRCGALNANRGRG